MFRISEILKIGLLLLLLGLLAACNSTAFGREPEQVSVSLRWLHQTQFAGYYVADKEGYYANEGLAVILDPVDFEQQSAITKVLAGEYEFGVASAEELVSARSEGKPVRAVAVIFRTAADVFLVRPDSGIKSPQDFVGNKVALSPGGLSIIYPAMMKNLGLDRSQIEEINYTGFDLFECWELAPVCPNYATNGPVILSLANQDFDLIWPRDYGITWYGDILFTTDQMISAKPAVVERFVRATLRGWKKAVEDRELAVRHTLAYDEQLDKTFQQEAMLASIPLIDTGGAPIGLMDGAVWQSVHDTLLNQELISAAVDVDSIFTNEFVEKAQ